MLTIGSRPAGHPRVCPTCGGRKDYYARACRGCAVWASPLKGKRGPEHPAWKGGQQIDRDGYLRTYDPAHPWPRRGGYVREHVRIMELQIGRRIAPGEVVHHINGDRRDNRPENLELTTASAHSREHRIADTHRRQRDARGRFAGKEVPNA